MIAVDLALGVSLYSGLRKGLDMPHQLAAGITAEQVGIDAATVKDHIVAAFKRGKRKSKSCKDGFIFPYQGNLRGMAVLNCIVRIIPRRSGNSNKGTFCAQQRKEAVDKLLAYGIVAVYGMQKKTFPDFYQRHCPHLHRLRFGRN